jgi:DNA-binding GntR family transcriptional regulator
MTAPALEIPNKTLAAQVQERIRDSILNRVLKPGERIDQNKLADMLNVSLVPVREALKSLESEGLVSIIPRRGAFVTEVSMEHLDDLYWARQVIEGEAVFHAVPCLLPSDFEAMERLIGQMEQATDAHDIHKFMELNRHFHQVIYDRLNNQHMLQTILSLWERSELYRYRYMFVLHNAERVHGEHRALVQACRSGDAALAKQLAIEHIAHTQRGIHGELEAELGSH